MTSTSPATATAKRHTSEYKMANGIDFRTLRNVELDTVSPKEPNDKDVYRVSRISNLIPVYQLGTG